MGHGSAAGYAHLANAPLIPRITRMIPQQDGKELSHTRDHP